MSVEHPLPHNDLRFVQWEAAGLWPQLKEARLFITGATGFFGRWLLESLFFANLHEVLGVRVTALSRDPEAFLRRAPHLAVPGLSWIKGSVTGLEAGDFAGNRFDAVIHLATEADMEATKAEPDAAVSVITEGTRRTLEVAAQTGARRFLFTSSGAVYGSQPGNPDRLSEDSTGMVNLGDNQSLYTVQGHAKLQAERLCMEYTRRDGLGAVIARGFSFAGPGLPLDSKFAFGNFIRDGLTGGPIVIRGDGTPVRSYLYAADLAVWLWTLLLRGVPGRAYNVGSERPVTMLELANLVSSELGASGVEVQQKPRPDGVMDRYIPSTQRARQEFGLGENFTLPEIIRCTASWCLPKVKH
jgi:dTDP-glucose 4,6-dehydratase